MKKAPLLLSVLYLMTSFFAAHAGPGAFYRAFGITAGDPMWRAAEMRVSIW